MACTSIALWLQVACGATLDTCTTIGSAIKP
jgi:hypothetical protein